MVCVIHAITQRTFSSSSIWVWSCAISFITASGVNAVCFMLNWDLHIFQICAICMAIDLIAGVIVSIIFRAQWFGGIVVKLFAMTPTDETISNVIDWENGSNAVIYFKNETCFFLGHVHTVGDGPGDGWICISAPIKYDENGNELYSHEDEKGTYLTIPMSEIKYIKIVN